MIPKCSVCPFFLPKQILRYELTKNLSQLDGCVSLAYTPNTSEAHEIMSILAQKYSLSMSPTPGDLSMDYDIVAFYNASTLMTYSGENLFKVQAGMMKFKCFGYLVCEECLIVRKRVSYSGLISNFFKRCFTIPM